MLLLIGSGCSVERPDTATAIMVTPEALTEDSETEVSIQRVASRVVQDTEDEVSKKIML